jgi:hypothetical protein
MHNASWVVLRCVDCGFEYKAEHKSCIHCRGTKIQELYSDEFVYKTQNEDKAAEYRLLMCPSIDDPYFTFARRKFSTSANEQD